MMKNILSKLIKIANKQQIVLNKLSQEIFDLSKSPEEALNDFIKYQLVSWGTPREIAAKESHIAQESRDGKHWDVDMTVSIGDPSKKGLVNSELSNFLQKKFDEVSKDPTSKWKALNGFTATFKVTVNN